MALCLTFFRLNEVFTLALQFQALPVGLGKQTYMQVNLLTSIPPTPIGTYIHFILSGEILLSDDRPTDRQICKQRQGIENGCPGGRPTILFVDAAKNFFSTLKLCLVFQSYTNCGPIQALWANAKTSHKFGWKKATWNNYHKQTAWGIFGSVQSKVCLKNKICGGAHKLTLRPVLHWGMLRHWGSKTCKTQVLCWLNNAK